MKILVITNIYPPQELGGYGRSIGDFVWGLKSRGNRIQVLTSNIPELGECSQIGPSGEVVDRRLRLKGTYIGGVKHIQNKEQRKEIDNHNERIIKYWLSNTNWDGILLGNMDLIGHELLGVLLKTKKIIQHHIGFVHPPFHPSAIPAAENYKIVAASKAVKISLYKAGITQKIITVVYPGARTDQLGPKVTRMLAPLPARGTKDRPLKVCYAGLLMMSKGVHTLVEAVIKANKKGICIQASIAGDSFQAGYLEQLKEMVAMEKLDGIIQFVGQLDRKSLARFYSLHHVGVFPSIHPEAFGIVAAEMMASGLTVISSCVGGAGELVDHGKTGLAFKPGDSEDLAKCLEITAINENLRENLSKNGKKKVDDMFSVKNSSKRIEEGFGIQTKEEITNFN